MWVKAAKLGNGAVTAPGSRTVAELEAEVARLRSELEETKMERDIEKRRQRILCLFHANRTAVPRQSEQAFQAKPSMHSTAKRALRTWRRGVSFFTPSRLRWSNHFGVFASIHLRA